ncbi:MAG: NADH-ubiquinone oxidoreductase subunit E family protein, partial [Aliarcobacter sp.]|nr:NADH-ubiquinone oxidoreductase subunit E family protein [Aliarcobacter sp.]
GDFANIQKSADVIYEAGYTLMNSIKFTEVDWTLVVKKVKPEVKVEESDAKEKSDD